MKVIIAGGRDFKNYKLLKEKCDIILRETVVTEIVSGKQMSEDSDGNKWGADYLGELYAKEKGFPVKPFPADWTKYGKAAGPIRNKEMAVYADYLIAFWDGKSTGTKDMIEKMKAQNKSYRVIYY